MQMDSPRPRSVAIVLHDVAPQTHELCQRLLSLVSNLDYTAPVTLLIVPTYHGGSAITEHAVWRRWVDVRLARGDEIALHGLRHRDESPAPTTPAAWFARRVLTDSEAEFAAIGLADARRRIESGLALLERCGWQARGFAAPAWQMNVATRSILADFPFAYTSTRNTLYELPTWRPTAIDSLGFSVRAAWRRSLSKHWNVLKARVSHADSALRVALHPADALYPEMMDTWHHLLHALLSDRVAVTKSQLVANRHSLGRTAAFSASPSLQAREAR
jgi:predicted deacetylase